MDVAAMCDRDDQQVASDVERVRTGLRPDEPVLFFIDVASVLNVSTDYLLGLTDDTTPPTPATGAYLPDTLRRAAGACDLEGHENDVLRYSECRRLLLRTRPPPLRHLHPLRLAWFPNDHRLQFLSRRLPGMRDRGHCCPSLQESENSGQS